MISPAVVIQDVRGRYASEGAFNAHFQEVRDGADPIASAAAQPWSRGVVGTSDRYEGSAYQGGAKVLHDLRWVVEDIIPSEIRRRVARGGEPPEGDTSLDPDTVSAKLPLGTNPAKELFALTRCSSADVISRPALMPAVCGWACHIIDSSGNGGHVQMTCWGVDPTIPSSAVDTGGRRASTLQRVEHIQNGQYMGD